MWSWHHNHTLTHLSTYSLYDRAWLRLVRRAFFPFARRTHRKFGPRTVHCVRAFATLHCCFCLPTTTNHTDLHTGRRPVCGCRPGRLSTAHAGERRAMALVRRRRRYRSVPVRPLYGVNSNGQSVSILLLVRLSVRARVRACARVGVGESVCGGACVCVWRSTS